MKYLYIILISWTIISCHEQQKVTSILIEVADRVDVIFYTAPLSVSGYVGFIDTLVRNENGHFELTFDLSQPSFIHISYESLEKQIKLLVEPGNNYNLSISSDKSFQINGANAKGQMLYASLSNPSVVINDVERIADPYNDTLSLAETHQKVVSLKEEELAKFKSLLKESQITKSFYRLIEKDRDCYFAALESIHSLRRTYKDISLDMPAERSIIQNLRNIYAQYPPNDNRYVFSSFWYEYAGFYINAFQQFIQQDFQIQKFDSLKMNKVFHTYTINETKQYLTGKGLEYFQARYIHSEFLDENDTPEIELLFEQFKKDYPNSKFTRFFDDELFRHK